MSQIEYYDPNGISHLVLPHLHSRLPLRNLHWKSPTRPVRSITSLHVDFVKATEEVSSRASSKDHDSLSIGREHTGQAHARSQRHQIPGLRKSPYLKLLFLRCDDKETYKSSSRQLVREWLRDNVSPNAKKDNHDAFEWLVVHVVYPDTAAASEARWSRSSGSGDEIPKQKSVSASRWTSKSSGSILEKLKSDFNYSSKTAPDRISQVKLSKQDVTHLESAETHTETEDGNWSDILAKLKVLVLMSFSLRVAQYEDDVRQKDLQRSLPGWNFCTFFILKEGLGLAFENVGLVEDSLAVYDELAAGLDTMIEEQGQAGHQDRGTDFLPCSPDLERALNTTLDSAAPIQPAELRSLSPTLKPYRELIVSNNISVFDMKCYVFAKQMALLLRLASPKSMPSSARDDPITFETSTMQEEQFEAIGEIEDPQPLAVLCQRATEFLTFMGRLMRQEMLASAGSTPDSAIDVKDLENGVSQLVLSWSFSVARQIIIETASPSFPSLPGFSSKFSATRADQFPSRRTSLAPQSQNVLSLAAGATTTSYNDDLFKVVRDLPSVKPLQNVELSNAAAHRADLYLLQRKLLQRVEESYEKQKFAPRSHEGSNGLSEKPATNLIETQSRNIEKDLTELCRGVTDIQLRESIMSKSASSQLYISLSSRAAWNYMIAGRKKSAQRLHADIAITKFNECDYATAAGYFNQFTSSYGSANWQSIESRLLFMHAQCLKALNRRDEHLRILSSLLAKAAAQRQVSKVQNKLKLQPVSSDPLDVASLLKEAVAASIELPYDFTIPMMTYFNHLEIEKHICLFEDRDGFKMSVKVRQNLVESLHVDHVKLQLLSEADSSAKDIWLQTEDPLELGHNLEEVVLSSNTSTLGIYVVAKVVLTCGRIAFTHNFTSKIKASVSLMNEPSRLPILTSAASQKHIRCYPRNGSLTVQIKNSTLTWIGKQRSLEIRLCSGLNDLRSGNVNVRANTAGLRLFTKDAVCVNDATKLTAADKPGMIQFNALEAQMQLQISVPWSCEQDVAVLSLMVDVEYTTEYGTFYLSSACDLDVDLPLDVNVQDLFKEAALMSQFLLKPMKAGPIHIINAHLQGSEDYEVVPVLEKLPRTTTAFLEEPACMTCKVLRKASSGLSSPVLSLKLLLKIEYRLVEQDILDQTSALLLTSLKKSSFSQLAGLIVPIITQKLTKLVSKPILENSGLLARFSLPDYEAFEWQTIIKDLPPRYSGLRQWLKHWHRENCTIRLLTPTDRTYMEQATIEKLHIDFEVPRVDFLHTASVIISGNDLTGTGNGLRPPVIVAGEPLEAQISIRHTRVWSGGTAINSDVAVAFLYELTADPNIWLIAGQRRTLFSAAEGEMLTQKVLLVPLMPGYHVLPSVEVKILASATQPASAFADASDKTRASTSTGSSKVATDNLVCETDCTSQADMLLVIEGVAGTTVGVGSNHNGGELQTSSSDSIGPKTGLIESEAIDMASVRRLIAS